MTTDSLGVVNRAPEVSFAEAAVEIITVGRYLGDRGLVPATSGNFSRRIDAKHLAITASGFDKGFLRPEHILFSPIDGPHPANSSAETDLHRALYRNNPTINGVLHTHSVAQTLLSARHLEAGELRFEGYEIQKALFGIPSHEVPAVLLVFENDQDIAALEARVTQRLKEANGVVVGYLLSNHGLYTWGASLEDARRHAVGIEFLLNCELEKLRWRPAA
jgi:methylthioribulose-1-phosphate dehydratase